MKLEKVKLPYDDYVMGETQLNCDNQNVPQGYLLYFWAYEERVMHEVKLLNSEGSNGK
jgi:hypothetical protein